jgi:hypothetical protein
VVVEANTPAPYGGYWRPRLNALYREHEEAWERAQVPQRYAKGEAFEVVDRSSMGQYAKVAPRTVWHYLGEAVPATVELHPRIAQGIARGTREPEPLLRCQGTQPCPRTGVWAGQEPNDHPLAQRYNRWDRSTYVEKDGYFPNPMDQGIDIASNEVSWLWLDNANHVGLSGIADVTLTDLHDAQGKPRA